MFFHWKQRRDMQTSAYRATFGLISHQPSRNHKVILHPLEKENTALCYCYYYDESK